MAKYIYVWDERVKWKAMTKAGDNNCMLLKVKETDAMSNIVSRIVSYVEPGGIEVLRIIGHGYVTDLTGVLKTQVWGTGTGTGQLGAEGINVHMVPKFHALKGLFAPGGRIEFHTCKLGDPTCQMSLKADVRCSDWLQQLADAVGADVVAAEQIQYIDEKWAWEGPTVTYSPTVNGGSDMPPGAR